MVDDVALAAAIKLFKLSEADQAVLKDAVKLYHSSDAADDGKFIAKLENLDGDVLAALLDYVANAKHDFD